MADNGCVVFLIWAMCIIDFIDIILDFSLVKQLSEDDEHGFAALLCIMVLIGCAGTPGPVPVVGHICYYLNGKISGVAAANVLA